jgi:hypothetical protein
MFNFGGCLIIFKGLLICSLEDILVKFSFDSKCEIFWIFNDWSLGLTSDIVIDLSFY